MALSSKFIYGLVREGARAKDYETAILWLSDCGLVHKVSRVNTVGIPLRAYEDLKAFKLFVVDVGLLGCMAGLRQRTLLDGNDLFVEFKGALTEQYVCQQLKTIEDLDVYYYTNDRGSCEIDFVVDTGERIVPVEVKAEVNLRAKSLKTYVSKILHTGRPLVYVDCFAGKGKFDDGNPGSPLIALEAIDKCQNITSMKFSQIEATFIDLNYADDLRKNLQKYPWVNVIDGKYEDNLANILQGKEHCNVFLYIDPYGIKALKFSIFDDLSKKNFNSIESI